MRLEDKVAIVTGASNGMGASTAQLFAAEGATVVLTDILEEGGQKVADSIVEAGGKAVFMAADVTSDQDWARVIDQTHSEYGKLDVLVNNAGISSSAVGDDHGIAGWTKLMDVNANSVFLGTMRAADIMSRAGSGSIVNVSSIMGIAGSPAGHPGYYAAKAAVRNFSKAMACRLGPKGVRVNSVHPGFMEPMVNSTNAGTRAARAEITPLRRTGRSIEVAYGILFLASDEASFISGTELVIDGGFLAQ